MEVFVFMAETLQFLIHIYSAVVSIVKQELFQMIFLNVYKKAQRFLKYSDFSK